MKKKPNEKTVFVRLDIPQSIHARLKAEAALQGKRIPDLAIEILNRYLPKR